MGLDGNTRKIIEELYEEMFPLLFSYANSSLYEPSLAEEAVQETFRIACAKANDLMASENPNGWVINVLKNVMKNMNRRRARLSNLFVSSLLLDERLVFESQDERELDVLYSDLIDKDDYELLKRVVLKRYSMLEAANELGITVEACKKRVQRAKTKLKNILEKMGDDLSP